MADLQTLPENPYEVGVKTEDELYAETLRMADNTSGLGKGHPIPEGVRGWSWGGFAFSFIWGLSTRVNISLFALVPYIGWVMSLVLGAYGREWAWQNKRWESVEHFRRVQRKWSIAAAILYGLLAGLFSLAIAIEIVSSNQ